MPPEANIVSAHISGITSLGEVSIKFNTPMKIEQVNITHINFTVLDIYIKPALDRHLIAPDFNLTSLNFTWNIILYQEDTLKIKLNFSDPLTISPLLERDILVVHFKELRDYFVSDTYLKDLHYNFTTL